MLELRPSCELCGDTLDPNSADARICTYECTFCARCATWELHGICPNCGGELVTRPRRPAEKLARDPATTTKTRKAHDVATHRARVDERLRAGDLPIGTWSNTFVNGRVTGNANDGYVGKANEMEGLAAAQPGFLGIDSVRGADGVGITVSQWSSLAAMLQWRAVAAHADAQRSGRDRWYEWYRSDVGRIDRTSAFGARPSPRHQRTA